MSDCECLDRGIPEGVICGKPTCPQAAKANADIRDIFSALEARPVEAAPPSGQRFMRLIENAEKAGAAPEDSAG